jgi:hypothetical protein
VAARPVATAVPKAAHAGPDDLERIRVAGADHVFWAMDTEPEEQRAGMAEPRRSIQTPWVPVIK